MRISFRLPPELAVLWQEYEKLRRNDPRELSLNLTRSMFARRAFINELVTEIQELRENGDDH